MRKHILFIAAILAVAVYAQEKKQAPPPQTTQQKKPPAHQTQPRASSASTVKNWQQAVVATSYTNATNTLTDIDGLNFAVTGGVTFTMTCYLFHSGTVSGMDINLTGPAGATYVGYGYRESLTNVGLSDSGVATAFGTRLGAAHSVTAGATYPAIVQAGFTTGATAGTVSIQAAADTGGTITVFPGSFCYLANQ